jgi:hypothetical protein
VKAEASTPGPFADGLGPLASQLAAPAAPGFASWDRWASEESHTSPSGSAPNDALRRLRCSSPLGTGMLCGVWRLQGLAPRLAIAARLPGPQRPLRVTSFSKSFSLGSRLRWVSLQPAWHLPIRVPGLCSSTNESTKADRPRQLTQALMFTV